MVAVESLGTESTASGTEGIDLRANGDGWELMGDMSFATATKLLQLGTESSQSRPSWIDLRRVTRVDSVGLAILLSWIRMAKRQGREVQLRYPPPQLASLAKFYNVQSICICES
ncbi:MAG: STAS domain-containing protein [Candidatus Porifericomitaceae bacterium WSBS_2022_MAG_OTU9]